MARVVVVRTGVANSASVRAAFDRLGAEVEMSDDPTIVDRADLLVLPGVGSFAAGMAALERAGLVEALRERIRDQRATLAICLGLQLLCAESDESPGVRGLGVIDQRVTRFGPNARVPQFGWNLVRPESSPTEECASPRSRAEVPALPALMEPGHAYFANSYRLPRAPEGWVASWSDHAGPFVAAIQRGPVLACQFHPELSGPFGASLIRRWLEWSPPATPPSRAEDARC